MPLLNTKIELQKKSIAVVSAAHSRVRFQLPRIGLPFEIFKDYSSLYRHCKEHKPSLIIVTQDNEAAPLANMVLEKSDTFGMLGIPILAIGHIQTENSILNLVAEGVGDVVSTEAVDLELIARINALVYRSQAKKIEREFYPYLFKLDCREIFQNDVFIDTTILEFKLALFLFSNPNVVHSREGLLKQVWGISASIDSRRVDTHISRIRAKLKLDGQDNQWNLVSVYTRGYMLKDCELAKQ